MAEKRASALYLYSIILGAAALMVYGVIAGSWSHWQPRVGPWAVLFWLIACAASNLLPAPVTADVEVTMSSPVNIAIAFLFPPAVAAAIVGLGSLTDWELRRETTLVRSAFNRSQLALAAAAASVFLHPAPPTAWRMGAGILCYNLFNLLFVTVGQHLVHGTRLTDMFRQIVTPLPSFIGSYLILGALGVIFALVYRELGWWAVAPFLVPLLFARYALRHSKQLEQAQRERRALADKLIDERERERARIASDMHDLVLQRLAAVQIQSDNIGSALKAGKGEQASALASMVKEQVAGAIADIRTAIKDLRRSALDGADLGGTLDRYVRAFQAETAIDVDLDVDGLEAGELPLPVALLLYECTQEALTNVVRHAGASHVDLRLHRLGDSVELRVRDNGRGPSGNGNGGVHLGLTLTKDKVALVGGGAWFEGCEDGGAQVIVRIPVRSTD
jgi:signal transduction histidine kinase